MKNLITLIIIISLFFGEARAQDDGARDAEGNCLGQVYIFTGRGMRCRPPGYSTGFHNCCNNSQGVITDSTGTAGTFNTARNVIGGLKTGYEIVKTAALAAKIGENPGIYQFDTLWDTGQLVVTNTLANETITLSGNAAKVISNTPIAEGVDVAAGAALQNYAQILGPQIALSAVTMAIKDPALSSTVNIIGQALLGAGPVGIAAAVVSAAMTIFTEKCDQQDIETSTLNDSKYCHYVGDYCEKKWPLIGCVQKAKGYCCFNSKLGRIIHEQGRPQLINFGADGGWGSGKAPNCRGFTPEEFQMLDFSKIDMSEYFGDIQTKSQDQIQQNATDKVQQYYRNIR
ncbi:MAG: conjugal transfer protein TraN [Nitrospirota bacterium]